MTRSAIEIAASIQLDDSRFNQVAGRVQQTAQKLSQRLQGMANVARNALLIGGAGIAGVAKLASDAEETASKFQAVFKGQADAARAFGDNLAKSVGRSRYEIQGFLASMQDTFVPLGFARDKAKDLSQQVTKLAIDLASFNNTSDSEALMSLQSALVGNHETMRKYGVIITEATLGQELLAQGIDGGTKAATEQEKALARMSLIMKGTTDAQGDAERTSGSLANQFKALTSQAKDLSAEIGKAFVPALKSIIERINPVLSKTSQWAQANTATIVKLTAVAAAVGGVVYVLPKFMAGIESVTMAAKFARTAFIAFNAASLTLKATLAIGVVGALVAVVGWLSTTKTAASATGKELKNLADATDQLADAQARLNRFRETGDRAGQVGALETQIRSMEEASVRLRQVLGDREFANISLADAKPLIDQLGLDEIEGMGPIRVSLGLAVDQQGRSEEISALGAYRDTVESITGFSLKARRYVQGEMQDVVRASDLIARIEKQILDRRKQIADLQSKPVSTNTTANAYEKAFDPFFGMLDRMSDRMSKLPNEAASMARKIGQAIENATASLNERIFQFSATPAQKAIRDIQREAESLRRGVQMALKLGQVNPEQAQAVIDRIEDIAQNRIAEITGDITIKDDRKPKQDEQKRQAEKTSSVSIVGVEDMWNRIQMGAGGGGDDPNTAEIKRGADAQEVTVEKNENQIVLLKDISNSLSDFLKGNTKPHPASPIATAMAPAEKIKTMTNAVVPDLGHQREEPRRRRRQYGISREDRQSPSERDANTVEAPRHRKYGIRRAERPTRGPSVAEAQDEFVRTGVKPSLLKRLETLSQYKAKIAGERGETHTPKTFDRVTSFQSRLYDRVMAGLPRPNATGDHSLTLRMPQMPSIEPDSSHSRTIAGMFDALRDAHRKTLPRQDVERSPRKSPTSSESTDRLLRSTEDGNRTRYEQLRTLQSTEGKIGELANNIDKLGTYGP